MTLTVKVLSRLNLASKLILALLIAGVIPMLVAAFISLRLSGDLKNQAADAQRSRPAPCSTRSTGTCSSGTATSRRFAQRPPARNTNAKGLQASMDRMMGTHTPMYNLMVVADVNGRVVAANTVDIDGNPVKTGSLLGTDPRRRDGELGRFFNRMMPQLPGIIRGVGENARRLNLEADRSGQASNEAGRAAIEIATTIERVAASATEQADQARLASEAVTEIARGAQEVANLGEAATAAAIQAAAASQTPHQATEAMLQIQEAANAATSIGALIHEVQQESRRAVEAMDGGTTAVDFWVRNPGVPDRRAKVRDLGERDPRS